MLTSLIRNPPPSTPKESPEDILQSTSLTIFRPDAQRTFHGDPGSYIIYASKKYGNIRLQLADPEGRDERWLFAHHLWNSGVLLSELISREADKEEGGEIWATGKEDDSSAGLHAKGRWSVKNERVLELGAGTALTSIIATLSGAGSITISDYPAPNVLSNIRDNVDINVASELQAKAKLQVAGHEWGDTTDKLVAGHAYSFTRIIACDCLWLDGEHEALAKSMRHFLSSDAEARVWVVAGFHTGKRKVASFFETARTRARLEAEWIMEVDTDFRVRRWRPPELGKLEELGGRERWMVVAVLRIATGESNGDGEGRPS